MKQQNIVFQPFCLQFCSIQFNSIQKTLIIPQGAILLWTWRARKKIQKIHKVKRTIQQTQHHQLCGKGWNWLQDGDGRDERGGTVSK